MKYIFIVLLIVCSASLSAQTYTLGNRSKWNYLPNLDVSCDLYMLDRSRYYILLSVSYKDIPDILGGMLVSYGTVHKKGYIYYLKDTLCDAEIILEQVKHSNFIVRKGFPFMENEYFYNDGSANNLTDPFLLDIAGERKEKSERMFIYQKEKNSEAVPLRLGTYKNNNMSLSLDTEYRYQIHYLFENFSFLISEGQWSKKGNELTLYDPFLDHSFVALIKPDGLFMIHFPNNLNSGWNYSPVEKEMLPFIMR